jgi:hypothetical protein
VPAVLVVDRRRVRHPAGELELRVCTRAQGCDVIGLSETVKKKINPPLVPVVSKEILEQAKLALQTDRMKPLGKCKVCESEVAPNSAEGLCWVCRRLKISAWRDSDHQMPAQE